MKAERILEVEELSISVSDFGVASRPLFRQLNFSVQRGEVLAIIGQSGTGKTTLARAIVGLLPSNLTVIRGRIAVNGRTIEELNRRELRNMRRDEVNLIFQDPAAALNPTMRIGKQLFRPSGKGRDRKGANRLAAALDVLRRLQLDDPETCLGAYPFELSGGMKQRILIASSLLAGPPLIIADEPTSALDPVLRNHVLEIFLKLAREGGTSVVLITHDLPLVGSYADRVLTLHGETMVESSSPRDFLHNPHEAIPGRTHLPSISDGEGPQVPLENVPPALRVSGLTVDFPVRRKWPWQSRRQKRIIDGACLEVRRGEIVGLLGASGAGKSTLGRCILGLVEPSSGTISIDGEIIGPRRDLRLGNAVQVIYQSPYSSLSPKLTVQSIVLEALQPVSGLDRREREARFRRVMDDVGLGLEFAKQWPHQLSGGQRQRVAVARALIGRPRLVVADEPVSSLDTVACNHVLELIGRLRSLYGFACLFISHDLCALRVIADRIAVMEGGRIVETGTAERIFESPTHPCTTRFVSAAWPAPATAT